MNDSLPTVAAVDLAISESGAGEPLVILHGLFGSKRNWAAIANRFAASHRVLAAAHEVADGREEARVVGRHRMPRQHKRGRRPRATARAAHPHISFVRKRARRA